MSSGRSRDSCKLDANIVWWLADRLRLFGKIQSHLDIFETLRHWPLVEVMTMAYDIIDAVVIVSVEKSVKDCVIVVVDIRLLTWSRWCGKKLPRGPLSAGIANESLDLY